MVIEPRSLTMLVTFTMVLTLALTLEALRSHGIQDHRILTQCFLESLFNTHLLDSALLLTIAHPFYDALAAGDCDLQSLIFAATVDFCFHRAAGVR